MIEARMPDGTVLRFPAGTADDVVDRAAQEHMAQAGRMTEARQANSGVGGYLRGARRAIENGLAFGGRDEMGAAIDATVGTLFPNTGTWSERYDAALGRERAAAQTFAEDNPVTAAAGNVLGGIVAPGLTLAPAARGAGTAVQFLRSGLGRGAVAGGTGGAAAGFGEGEGGFASRVGSAVTGGAIGAVGGAAIGGGLSAGGQVAGRLGHMLGLRNPQVAADRQILRALERDGVDPSTLGRPQQGPGIPAPSPDAALVDMGGRNTVNLAATAANTPGAAMEAADQFVQARRLARPDRIAGAVDDGLGGGGGTRIADEVGALAQRRATEAQPRYQAAFSRIEPSEDEVARLIPGIEDPIGQQALREGLRVLEVENVAARLRDPSVPPFDPADYGITRGENGALEVTNGYRNLRLLDAIKRGYDEIVEGFRDQTSGRLNLNQYGRAVNDARAAYVSNMREMFPRYGGALDAWAGPSRSMDAVSRGRQVLRTDPDIVARINNDLSPSDREFFRLGVGRAITDAAADPARATTIARRLVEDTNMQRRLLAAIPDPAQRARFMATLQREVEMTAVERAVSPRAGSQTARLQAGGDDMQTDPPGGMLAALLMGRPIEAARQGASAFYRRTQGINPSTADALASRLMNPDGTANAETIRALLARRTTDIARAQERAGLMAALLRGGGVAAAIEAND